LGGVIVALEKCKECGTEISAKDDKCPECGAPITSTDNRIYVRKGFIRSLVIIMLTLSLIFKFVLYLKKKAEKEKVKQTNWESIDALRKQRMDEYLQKKQMWENERTEFTSNIEQHYQRLLFFSKEKNFNAALRELKLFKKYQKLDYKHVPVIMKVMRIAIIRKLEEKVRKIPPAKAADRLRIYKQLLALDPKNPRYKKKVAFYQAKIQADIP
jgi:hypothetical protein